MTKGIPNHNEWPLWPWLPMKRYSRNTIADSGLLHADDYDSTPCKLYIMNVFMVRSRFPTKDMEVREYPSLDALLADGWEVD